MHSIIPLLLGAPSRSTGSTGLATGLSIAAILIAGLALAISWLNHRHTVDRDTRLETRSVTVSCQAGRTTGPVLAADNSITTHLINVTAVNSGFRPVEIRSVLFEVSDGQSSVCFANS